MDITGLATLSISLSFHSTLQVEKNVIISGIVV